MQSQIGRPFRNYSDESRQIYDPVVFVSKFTERIRINLLKTALELFEMSKRERKKERNKVKFDMSNFALLPGYNYGKPQSFEVVSPTVASFIRSLKKSEYAELEFCGTACCACGVAAIVGALDNEDERGWSHAVRENLLPVHDDNLWNFFFSYLFAQYWQSDLLATANRIAHFAITMSLLEAVVPDNKQRVWHRAIQYRSSIPYLRGLDVDWNRVRAIIEVGFIDVTEVEIASVTTSNESLPDSVTESQKTTFPAEANVEQS